MSIPIEDNNKGKRPFDVMRFQVHAGLFTPTFLTVIEMLKRSEVQDKTAFGMMAVLLAGFNYGIYKATDFINQRRDREELFQNE